ncbi:hypothetical protein ETR_15491 [Erwinia tracheiphila PSU-1]|nr:hypothetical protein ETR_15491 [Erwinia tracheiphila PSU-1]
MSCPPWDALNLGAHVGDSSANVQHNRQYLSECADLPTIPVWLEQVHGTEVLHLTDSQPSSLRADASYTRDRDRVCTVMTADCLPVLFCSRDGKEIAAVHAGWRGLCNGVLEATLNAFDAPAKDIFAWMGPAIGPEAFEVGSEVRESFVSQDLAFDAAFWPAGEKYYADIWQLARIRLTRAGVREITGGGRCTFLNKKQFFSFRRDGTTGRMATLIWLI